MDGNPYTEQSSPMKTTASGHSKSGPGSAVSSAAQTPAVTRRIHVVTFRIVINADSMIFIFQLGTS